MELTTRTANISTRPARCCKFYLSIKYICVALLYFLYIFNVKANSHENELNQITSNIPYENIKAGRLYFKNDKGYYDAITQKSDYKVKVTGLLARVDLTQSFSNTSNDYLEAIYVFPLIDDAAIDNMTMIIGERKIIGKIKEKSQAKKLYKQAKSKGKKASLLSQQRPNIFTSKVSNIAPGETIHVSISYLQSIKYENDEFSLRIPLTLTPRYLASKNTHKFIQAINDNNVKDLRNSSVINDNGWANVSPPQTRSSKGQKATMDITLNTGLELTNINSSYHKISKSVNQKTVNISLKNKYIALDRDFLLSWQVAQGNSPQAALFTKSDDLYNYGLLMIMPPVSQRVEAISKEVIYIIDISGSMGGVAIEQAKEALNTALDLLGPSDSFNIIAFNNSTSTVFRKSNHANLSNVLSAKRWVNSLSANGGTNMYPAINLALSDTSGIGESDLSYKQVIFITDGSVDNEDELFNLIEKKLGNTRLHTIGIGSAPNTFFMSRAAEYGRGTHYYIGNINEVSDTMSTLFSDISQPIMRNISLDWPVKGVESYPVLIPDLYQNKPMIISARWPKSNISTDNINAKGSLANLMWEESISLGNLNNQASGIKQWWARQKLKAFNKDYIQANEVGKSKIKKQIIDLSLENNLLSPFTSFIAVEEVVTNNENNKLKTNKIANLMPKGSTQAIQFANTALGIDKYLYGGLILIFCALLLNIRGKYIGK